MFIDLQNITFSRILLYKNEFDGKQLNRLKEKIK